MNALATLGMLAVASGAAALVRRRGGGAPRGKGVWIRSLAHAGGVDGTIKTLRDLGCRWAILVTVWQEPDGKHKHTVDVAAFVRKARAAGISVWLGAWVVAGHEAALAEHWKEYRNGIAGFVVNAEASYMGKPEAGRELARRVRALGRPVALSSYGGGPPWAPKFPWSAFRGWIGMPQIYDMNNEHGAGYPRFSLQAWRRAGFRDICPTFGGSDAHTVEQMAAIATNTKTVRGVSWWDLYHLLHGRKRFEFVERFPAGTGFRFS